MRNTYEIMLLLRSGADKEKERVLEVIKEVLKAKKFIKQEDLGKRILSYPIQKQDDADYILVNLEADTADISSLNSKLRHDQSVLRFLVTKPEKIKIRKKAKVKKE